MESFELPYSLPGCYFGSAEDNKRAGPEAPVTLAGRPSAGGRAREQQKAKQAIRLSLAARARVEAPRYGAGGDLGLHLEHIGVRSSRG